ncbi:gluconeogenesis factor YvcK family protein [Thermovirga sp.]|uniref:gluconeogenesis factor YvcK family protein n=1 Tax=Thermovirga sp. TaxID=2699834 RepID=UPI0025E32365|nr:gluconeogenesis factor YvcK family protein [Thermovirga sp.]MBO8153116.1 YvcK family protein [Thermovirga sp.]
MNWWTTFTLGILAGGVLVFVLLLVFKEEQQYEEEKRFPISSVRTRERSIMSKAVSLRLAQGPRIVAVGGGTGLSTLLSGLKAYTKNITAVVTVTDEGGSSGRLRSEWGMLPPGDIRNCLVALAENHDSLHKILNFRFDRGELAGHSLGNLILLAVTEMTGDFRLAVEELNKLLAMRGQVLPVTTEAITIVGRTKDGQALRGELEIAKRGYQLDTIWIEPRGAKAAKGVLEAIENADLIVLGPGSLFTSVLPNLLIEDVAARMRLNNIAPKVYVANLMTQPGETDGLDILAHLKWVEKTLGMLPEHVVANEGEIPNNHLLEYRKKGASPLHIDKSQLNFLKRKGVNVIRGDFVLISEEGTIRHHSQKLAETIMKIAREVRES